MLSDAVRALKLRNNQPELPKCNLSETENTIRYHNVGCGNAVTEGGNFCQMNLEGDDEIIGLRPKRSC